jgi:hypothetical protein
VQNENNMKKVSDKASDDDLRKEYNLSELKGGVRGKYHLRATSDAARAAAQPPRRRKR